MIIISKNLKIPEAELIFIFSRAGGPGGQNVNKLSTKATLLYNVHESNSLSDSQKEKIKTRLATRINKNGILRVVAMRYRTQGANRDDAIERFAKLLKTALADQAPRKKTKATRASKEKRLHEKKQRGMIKQSRGRVGSDS